MTPRQARTQRREAERKAAKLARKAVKLETAAAGSVSQNPATLPNFGSVSQNALSVPHVTPAPRNPDAERRREINRANAQHSTGPRTPSGKLASSRNSLKHGLASGELIIPGEDRAAFDALLNDVLEEHRPANPTEDLLINEMAQAYWLVQRAIHFQNQCFTESGVDEKRLSLFLRYQTTHDRRFHKALDTLIRMKQNRARQQAATGFVRQSTASVPQNTAFVPQSIAAPTALPEIVPQNALLLRPHAGFVSQTEPSATSQFAFEPIKPAPDGPRARFVSQT